METAHAALRKNEFDRATALYTDAGDVARKGELAEEWFQAQIGLAQCYYRMGNNPEAYFLLSQAYEYARKHLGERWQYYALGNMAVIDSEQGDWGMAKKYFGEIGDWAERERDSVLQSTALGNLAELSGKTGDYAPALKYADRALALIPPSKRSFFAKVLDIKITVLCDSGEWPQAAALLDSLERLGPTDLSMRESMQLLRARVLFGEGRDSAAVDTARSVLLSADLLMRIRTRQLLAERAEAAGNYRASLEHERVAAFLRDSLAEVKLGATNKANVARLDLVRTRAAMEGKDRVIVWESIAIALMSVLAVAGIVLARHLLRRHRMSRERAEREKVNAELQLQDSIKAGDTLKSEIDAKNRTLASKMMLITRRGEIVEEFMRYLSEETGFTADPDFKRRLMQFKAEIKNSEDLENSMSYFENVNSGFLTRLREKHPDLNSNDIRFLCYVYMKLNTKEISSLLNIVPSSCKKRKQRLATKMGLDNAAQLYDYISGI